MNKQQIVLDQMVKMANSLRKQYSKDVENKIWSLAYDNDIFMCEHSSDDDVVDGFYIEDDYWLYNTMNGAE